MEEKCRDQKVVGRENIVFELGRIQFIVLSRMF